MERKRKITDEINSLSVYFMHTVENIPSRFSIVFESRIKQICPITLKGGWGSFSNFKEICQFQELINYLWKE